MGYKPHFGDVASYQPLDLIAGDYPLQSEKIILEAGQILTRGTLLGRKTANGKFVKSALTSQTNTEIKDGSEIPLRILAEDIDASDGDSETIAYLSGCFFQGGITLGKAIASVA